VRLFATRPRRDACDLRAGKPRADRQRPLPKASPTRVILDTIADLRVKGALPEDIADALFILGANAVVELMGAELTAQLLEAMARELRAGGH
jgi:hypothetical protein